MIFTNITPRFPQKLEGRVLGTIFVELIVVCPLFLRNYHQKYISDVRELFLLGINFDESDKNISRFSWQKIS